MGGGGGRGVVVVWGGGGGGERRCGGGARPPPRPWGVGGALLGGRSGWGRGGARRGGGQAIHGRVPRGVAARPGDDPRRGCRLRPEHYGVGRNGRIRSVPVNPVRGKQCVVERCSTGRRHIRGPTIARSSSYRVLVDGSPPKGPGRPARSPPPPPRPPRPPPRP